MTSISSNTKNPSLSPFLRGSMYSMLASIIYGLSYIFTKNISNYHSPMTIIGWRFLVAFLVMELMRRLGVVKINYQGKNIRALLRLVFLYPVIYFIAETFGIQLTTASESGIVIATIPVATLIFSVMILKEKPTRYQMIGIATSTLGIFLIVFSQSLSASLHVVGYLALISAVLSYALFAVRLIQETSFTTLEKTYTMMAIAAGTFFPIALLEHLIRGTGWSFITLPMTDMAFLGTLIYLALGSSVIAFFASKRALELLGPNQASTWGGLSTVITLTASVLILKEPFGLGQILAALLVVGGVYIANAGLSRSHKVRPKSDPTIE